MTASTHPTTREIGLECQGILVPLLNYLRQYIVSTLEESFGGLNLNILCVTEIWVWEKKDSCVCVPVGWLENWVWLCLLWCACAIIEKSFSINYVCYCLKILSKYFYFYAGGIYINAQRPYLHTFSVGKMHTVPEMTLRFLSGTLAWCKYFCFQAFLDSVSVTMYRYYY